MFFFPILLSKERIFQIPDIDGVITQASLEITGPSLKRNDVDNLYIIMFSW